jgi:cyclic beta-1,2-glucan synthetase
LPQSWSVIARAGDPQRSRIAMEAVDRRLVNRGARLIQLFSPPFDSSHLNPGYIKGYLPGVRENGGQYTHAALWTILAFAMVGDQRRAWELFSLINPVNHGATPAQIATYKVEPYVVAADVYAVPPHTGRGGWTWYTGSAGWMYRLLVDSLLGLQRAGETLAIAPCVPPEWASYKIHYRYFESVYHIVVVNRRGKLGSRVRIVLDGVELSETAIPLRNDLREHEVTVELS